MEKLETASLAVIKGNETLQFACGLNKQDATCELMQPPKCNLINTLDYGKQIYSTVLANLQFRPSCTSTECTDAYM